MDWLGYLKIFIALVFMVDPIAAIPTYLASTDGRSDAERARTASTAGMTVAVVLTVFCLAGEPLLALFGISVDSFRVAGGLILLTLAASMLRGAPGPTKQRSDEAEDALHKEQVGVVPIGIPLLAGPGAMSSMIVYASQAPGWRHRSVLLVISAAVAIVAWLSLRLAAPLGRLLGRTGMHVSTRIMGIILAAVAVEFIATGVLGLLPGLGG